MTKKTNPKTQRIKTAKISKSSAIELAYQRLADTLRPPAESDSRWINFAALRFCALALNSK